MANLIKHDVIIGGITYSDVESIKVKTANEDNLYANYTDISNQQEKTVAADLEEETIITPDDGFLVLKKVIVSPITIDQESIDEIINNICNKLT